MEWDISFFIPVQRRNKFTSCIVKGVSPPLFSFTKWIDIATVTQMTLKLGLLESKMDSIRVLLSITPVWADEQRSQPL